MRSSSKVREREPCYSVLGKTNFDNCEVLPENFAQSVNILAFLQKRTRPILKPVGGHKKL